LEALDARTQQPTLVLQLCDVDGPAPHTGSCTNKAAARSKQLPRTLHSGKTSLAPQAHLKVSTRMSETTKDARHIRCASASRRRVHGACKRATAQSEKPRARAPQR
jgi:hypothetical protein